MGTKKTVTPNDSDLFETDDLDLINFLLLYKIEPIKRETDGTKSSLFYRRSADLDKLIITSMNPCAACGIRFSDVGPARARARRLLLEGIPE